MLSVFFILCFLCLVRRLLPFFAVLFRVAVRKNFRERTFVFGCRCWSCVFLVGFCLCFAYVLAARSRKCLEFFFLMSGLLFLGGGVVLSSLGFYRRRRFCLFFFVSFQEI